MSFPPFIGHAKPHQNGPESLEQILRKTTRKPLYCHPKECENSFVEPTLNLHYNAGGNQHKLALKSKWIIYDFPDYSDYPFSFFPIVTILLTEDESREWKPGSDSMLLRCRSVLIWVTNTSVRFVRGHVSLSYLDMLAHPAMPVSEAFKLEMSPPMDLLMIHDQRLIFLSLTALLDQYFRSFRPENWVGPVQGHIGIYINIRRGGCQPPRNSNTGAYHQSTLGLTVLGTCKIGHPQPTEFRALMHVGNSKIAKQKPIDAKPQYT
ncbi:hypothetical protein CIHG_10241 [Coccidioides immitis H538.4]|uniref:Uncharacterized protein n=1 Tax=Coccidioides immitis H538.4 TaxID=396776 RepID=A0A0J8S5P8_COCIT|nr:hypothetical protein CIHG_10241 [Coccidioides immitis H538.4]